MSGRQAHAAYWLHFFVDWTDWSVRYEALHSAEGWCPFPCRHACVMISQPQGTAFVASYIFYCIFMMVECANGLRTHRFTQASTEYNPITRNKLTSPLHWSSTPGKDQRFSSSPHSPEHTLILLGPLSNGTGFYSSGGKAAGTWNWPFASIKTQV